MANRKSYTNLSYTLSTIIKTIKHLSSLISTIMHPNKTINTTTFTSPKPYVKCRPRNGKSATFQILVSRENPCEKVVLIVLYRIPKLPISLKGKMKLFPLYPKVQLKRLHPIIELSCIGRKWERTRPRRTFSLKVVLDLGPSGIKISCAELG